MAAATVSQLPVARHLSDRQPKPKHAPKGSRPGTVEEIARSARPLFSEAVLDAYRQATDIGHPKHSSRASVRFAVYAAGRQRRNVVDLELLAKS